MRIIRKEVINLNYTVQEVSAAAEFIIPHITYRKIVIPAYCWNGQHCYYYYDFEKNQLRKYSTNIKKRKQYISEYLKQKFSYHLKEDLLNPFNFALVPHSSLIYNDFIFIFMVNSYFFVMINTKSNEMRFIEDPDKKMISSTNTILDNCLYYARYSIEDRYYNLMENRDMKTEIIKYNLITNKFTVLKKFFSCNICHSFSVTIMENSILPYQLLLNQTWNSSIRR